MRPSHFFIMTNSRTAPPANQIQLGILDPPPLCAGAAELVSLDAVAAVDAAPPPGQLGSFGL
jgi:hypothetical protein